MPLKIRCPHCHRVLIAEIETAGQQKICPACSQPFNVPLASSMPVISRPKEPAATFPKCPRCSTELAAAATYCYKCHTDLKTGKRLPLKRRLRLFSWQFWTVVGGGVAVLVLLSIIAVRVFLIHSRPSLVTEPAAAPSAAVAPADELVEALFAARTLADNLEAVARLATHEARIAPAVAAGLKDSLERSGADNAQRNRVAAIDLLARNGGRHPESVAGWVALLERCTPEPALRAAALRARAVLGDARVLEDLTALWLERVRRLLLLTRLAEVSAADGDPSARLVLRRARAAVDRCADGLRVLAQNDENRVFEQLAEHYWDSWTWLGQGPGDGLADELFALARPDQSSLEFRPEDVRQPRDVLRRVADRGSPLARAAAGLILGRCAPQYSRLRRRIADRLGELLPQVTSAEQQRLTWTISQLGGRLFGHTAREHPLDVTAPEIAAALEWAHHAAPPVDADAYPSPPALGRRAVTPERVLERDLLRGLQRGWIAGEPAVDRWLTSGLGVTPALRELIDPGQRQPDYAALASGLVIVAAVGEESVRPQLELWSEAADQPAWVRALAYTVLGSLDARRGWWRSSWPAGLDLGDPALLDTGRPGWEHFGRVLAVGGPEMLRRLERFSPAPLEAAVQDRLLEAARRAADRYDPRSGP